MKINTVNFRTIENTYKMNKAETKQTIGNKTTNRETEKLEISDLGKYLNEVGSGKEDMNIEKINYIKRKIESGTYKVDSKDLAKSIMQHMKGEI